MTEKIIIILFFCFSMTTLFCQPRGLIKSINKTEKVRGKTFALIFGISEYQNIQDLQFADDDANAFANYLESTTQKDSLVLLKFIDKEATRGKFFPSLFQISEEADSLDRVFIFFSGHGDAENDIDPNAYLLPHNAPANNYAYNTISIDFFQSHIDDLTKRGCEVIVIIDACRSGALAGEIVNGRKKLALALTQYSNEIKILSCEPHEESIESAEIGGGRGLFSYCLESGLAGEADIDKDKTITLREIESYLNLNVPEMAESIAKHNQHPEVRGNKESILAEVIKENLVFSMPDSEAIFSVQKKHSSPKALKEKNQNQILLNTHQTEKSPQAQKVLESPKDSFPVKNNEERFKSFGILLDSIQHDFNDYLASQDLAGNNFNPQKVIPLLEKALDLCPSKQKVIHDELRGKLLFFRSLNSIEGLKKAEKLLPNAPFVFYELSKNYRWIGDKKLEQHYLNLAKKYSPTSNYKLSTMQPNVHLVDANFYIPQLNRKRKVWVYLPPDYETSSKNYPVIYMQDGQALFDERTSSSVNGGLIVRVANSERDFKVFFTKKTSSSDEAGLDIRMPNSERDSIQALSNEKSLFPGEWSVDETMNSLFGEGDYGAIIIAVENAGWRRFDEYSPWYNNELEAGGEGKEYAKFLVETLKPYVDATYRTLPEREYTGLVGSSLGGFITHYIAMEYQNVFSKIGVMSPSFWFSKEVYDFTSSKGKRADMKYYIIAGQNEGTKMLSGLNQMYDVMRQAGFSKNEVRKVIHIDGEHNETYWGREFGTVYKWLFDGLNLKD